MYGLTGTLTAKSGQRAAFVEILLRAAQVVGQMPGCRLYVVCEDQTDANVIRVFEVWDDQAAHAASLQNEQVRALIGQAMPLMDGAPQGVGLMVAGGHGLQAVS